MQVDNYFNNSFYSSIILPEDLWLGQLIDKGDENGVLRFLKTCTCDLDSWKSTGPHTSQKGLIAIALEHSWDDVLVYLSERKVNFLPEIARVISHRDSVLLAKLLGVFKGDLNASMSNVDDETVLWHALNEKNYEAAALLVSHGASLEQRLPNVLTEEVKANFKVEFFKNKYYFGLDGDKLFEQTFMESFCNQLFEALAYHYYPHDPRALDFLLAYPHLISLSTLKALIRLNDTRAFKSALAEFLNQASPPISTNGVKDMENVEKNKADLLHYALRDFNFSLMGFEGEYILPRIEIIKTLLALNPSTRTIDKYGMTTHEIAQYLKLSLSEDKAKELEALWVKLLEDPTGFHEVWRLQKLLVNNWGVKLPHPQCPRGVEIASFPSVTQYFQQSVARFMQETQMANDWVFVTPQKKFTVENCLQMIHEKKILKFFTGWTGGFDEGHGINAVIYDNILWVCNRGGGSKDGQTCGVCIYEIQDASLHKELVELFLERSDKTQEFITKGLLQHAKIKTLKSLHLKGQRVGNCVYLSEKMGVYACFIATYIQQGQLLESALASAKTLYKQWSRKDRIELFKAYLDHPYHLRLATENEKEGISLTQLLFRACSITPKNLHSQYLNIILEKLQGIESRAALGIHNKDELWIKFKLDHFTHMLAAQDTASALSFVNKLKNVNIHNGLKVTPLHLACRYGNLKVVKRLLRRGANPLHKCVNSRSALHELFIHTEDTKRYHADSVRHQALVKLMVKETQLDKLAKTGSFPLHTAICFGDEIGVHEIMKKGFDLCLSNKYGENAFHYAAMSKSALLTEWLLKQCPDINMKTQEGNSLLFYAVRDNNVPAVKLLLTRDVHPNALAQTFGVNILDNIEHNDQREICELLIQKGADVNAPTYLPGISLLMKHCMNGNKALVEVFLRSPNLDLKKEETVKGQTSLTQAIIQGWKDVVNMLLDKGMNPNYADILGVTPLHTAVFHQDVEICKLLIARGAKIQTKDLRNQTPYDWNKQFANEELAALLAVPEVKHIAISTEPSSVSSDLPVSIEDAE